MALLRRKGAKIKNLPKVSVIIPAYNEAKTIQRCLGETFRVMEGFGVPYEVIVVDDGSVDGTIEAVQPVRNLGPLRIFKNGKNEGKASAVLRGIDEAEGDIIVTLDGDGQHSPKEIPLIIKPILEGRVKAVIGSRFLEGNNRIPFRHFLANSVIRGLFNLLYGASFTDVLLGFRAFRKEVLRSAKLKTKGYLFEVEVLKELLAASSKVGEVGVTCFYPKKSSVPRGLYLTAQILLGTLHFKISSVLGWD